RAGVHAAEGNRGAAVARVVAGTTRSAVAGGEPRAVVCWRRGRPGDCVLADERIARAGAVAGAAGAHLRVSRSAHPDFYSQPDGAHWYRLRPAAGASRQPHRSVDDD